MQKKQRRAPAGTAAPAPAVLCGHLAVLALTTEHRK